MFGIQPNWFQFGSWVVLPLIFSFYFLFSYLRQRKNINRLRKKEWNTINELDKKEILIRSSQFIANISLLLFMMFFLFGLAIAAKLLKFF